MQIINKEMALSVELGVPVIAKGPAVTIKI